MIRIIRSSERGHRDHGWLETHFSFSFADHFDPERMHFGPLRVLNQDRIAPGAGFPTHGHADMEIVTVVLEGALEHRDSMGNGSVMRPGEVQFMSAGTGVQHSEFNPSPDEELHLLQMWVIPSARGFAPRYGQRAFPEEERDGALRLVVSPDGADGSLTIGQDARLYVGTFDAGQSVQRSVGDGRGLYLHVATGTLEVDGERLDAGDAVEVTGAHDLAVAGVERAQLVAWDLPL